MKRYFIKKSGYFHFTSASFSPYLFATIIAIIYAFYIANIASFQSDWAAYYLFFDELLSSGKIANYFMPPTPALFQIITYMLPIYILFGISFKTFYLVIFLQTMINAIALYVLIRLLFKKLTRHKIILPLFIFCFTLLGPLLQIIDSAMFRKDIPLILLAIYWIFRLSNKTYRAQKVKYKRIIVIAVLFLSITAFGDPFTTYMLLFPLIISNLLFFILNTKSSYKLFRVSVYSLISIILAFIARSIVAKYFVNMYSETTIFVNLDQISKNFNILFSDINALFPMTGIFGSPVLSLSNFPYIVNVFIFSLFIISIVHVSKRALLNNKPLIFYLSLLPIFSTMIYLFSTRPQADNLTMRYHILFTFLIYIIIFYFLEFSSKLNKRLRVTIYLFLIAHFFLLLNFFLVNLRHQLSNMDRYTTLEANTTLINLLHTKSLKKGFAGYWDSSNNTYYSRNKIHIRPILCDFGFVVPFYWFSFSNWYEPEKNVYSSFIYVDKSTTTHTSGCDILDLRNQFGQENEAIEFEPKKYLYIWDYDISSKIEKRNILEKTLMK